jgi:hypothetical protein
MHREKGLVKIILAIIVALIILGYFGFDIKAILAKPVVHDNLVYVWGLVVYTWAHYISGPVIWIWEHVISPLLSKK